MQPFADRIVATLAGVERWLLPPACLLCNEPVAQREDDPLICDLCRLRWRAVPHPVCERCGQPSQKGLECRLCAEWPAGLARARSAVWLDGSARAAVHRLKYEGWSRVAEAMAEAMRQLEPLTVRESDCALTSPGKRPCTESYLRRWASVLVSVRSFTATKSSSTAFIALAARTTLRPIRPKPLMPTRVGIDVLLIV